MLDPYKMVLVNVICSLLVLIGIFIYRFIYPKQKINLFYLLIIISLLPLISMLRKGTYESGDLSLHAMRAMSYFNILINDKILPNWTPEFNAYYGDPHFLFSYLLPYFSASLLHLVGFSFIASIKIILAVSFILSGIGMYVWIKSELGEKSAFISSIFYLFTPYHLVDMHFRVTVAECTSFLFLPFIMLFTKKLIETKHYKWLFFNALFLALLILSHQVIALSFFPLSMLYAIFVWLRQKEKAYKSLIMSFVSIILGLLLSCFYWLPILSEAKYTQTGSQFNSVLHPQLWELIYSPWRYGLLFQGHKGELSYLLGYTQLFILVMATFLLITNKISQKYRDLTLFFLGVCFVIIFLILPVSKIIWDNIPILNFFQFTTRLLVLVSLCIAVLAGIMVKKINKTYFLIILTFLSIGYTILNWGNRRSIPQIDDEYLRKEYSRKPDISGLEPSSPKWANTEKTTIRTKPTTPLEALNGNIEYKQILRNSTNHEYVVHAKSDSLIKENTLFFPGWNVYVNNIKYPIFYTTAKYPGIILFNLNKGFYKVEVVFENTQIRIFSRILSIGTLGIFLIFIIILLLTKLRKRY